MDTLALNFIKILIHRNNANVNVIIKVLHVIVETLTVAEVIHISVILFMDIVNQLFIKEFVI